MDHAEAFKAHSRGETPKGSYTQQELYDIASALVDADEQFFGLVRNQPRGAHRHPGMTWKEMLEIADRMTTLAHKFKAEAEALSIFIERNGIRQRDTSAMTPAEFAERMKNCDSSDTEVAHGDADDLMCELLTSLGYGMGVLAFKEMDKWYA